MTASTNWWSEGGGQRPLLTKRASGGERAKRPPPRPMTPQEVDWATERVKHYLRLSFLAVPAIERAVADLRALNA